MIAQHVEMGIGSLDKDILQSSIGNEFFEHVIDADTFFKPCDRNITLSGCRKFTVIFEINCFGNFSNHRL